MDFPSQKRSFPFSALLPEGWYFLFFEKVVDKSTFICYNVQGKAESVPEKTHFIFAKQNKKLQNPLIFLPRTEL